MKITEIFDTQLDLVWQQHGRHELSQFSVKEQSFQVQISKQPIPEYPTNRKTAEVSFSRNDITGVEKSYGTTNQNSVAAKIYGILFHALQDRFSEYDAFYFTAERRHSSSIEEYELKSRIYMMLLGRLARVSDARYYVKRDNRTAEFLLSKESLSAENTYWVDEIQEMQTLILPTMIARL